MGNTQEALDFRKDYFKNSAKRFFRE